MRASGSRAAAAAITCAAALAALPSVAADAPARPVDMSRRLADTYAGWAMRAGNAPGVGVAVLMPGAEPRLFTYGDAVTATGDAPRVPFSRRSLFEIASVTKVFTTNLLGQRVAAGRLDLDTPLTAYEPQLGLLAPMSGRVTLRELADFTGGWPDYPPRCPDRDGPEVHGCIPDPRPDIADYGAADFAAFFREAVPRNHQKASAPPVKRLPAPYTYSDASIGLLGLLLGAAKDRPLGDTALGGWFAAVERRILGPLGMKDTWLFVPPSAERRVARGYAPALATPVVVDGRLTAIDLVGGGLGYASAPTVIIVGGGGRGAQATARLAGGTVQSIEVTRHGHGYVTPAVVSFTAKEPGSGPAKTVEPAEASIVVSGGRVVAVVVDGGSGYTAPPRVRVSGGRRGGRDAVIEAKVANGAVVQLSVVDGGAGYVEPLSVAIAPGDGLESAIPIWAPAGSLHVGLDDMATFAAAALGRRTVGERRVPALLRRGVAVAMTPSACTGPDPRLAACPPGMPLSALAWAVEPADTVAGVPAVVSKGGALTGFSTAVFLMPEVDLGVVVFVNSLQDTRDGEPTTFAGHVARGVLYGLFYGCVAASVACR